MGESIYEGLGIAASRALFDAFTGNLDKLLWFDAQCPQSSCCDGELFNRYSNENVCAEKRP